MTNTLLGKNKATKQEIQKNNDKVVTYISQSVAQLYNMNLINERVICSLGNRMNEVYIQLTELNQEQLNMKAQISQIMAVQQQTMEALGAFVSKLNEKIESVDNFHMLISEIQNGMYNDSSKLYNLCSILSQLDKRQMDDNRKMKLLSDTIQKAGIIMSDGITVLQCLQEIVALPPKKIGLIYLELCNFRNSFPANLFADMIENYHFLSKMEKMSKKKEVLIQRVLDKYELDADAEFSMADISESFFENKHACMVNIANIQIGMNSASSPVDESYVDSGNDELPPWSEELMEEKVQECLEDDVDLEAWFDFLKPYAEQGVPRAMYEYADFYEEDDPDKYIEYLTKSADAGIPDAQCDLGRCYLFGEYVTEDKNKAFSLFRKSAEQGYGKGQFWLGKCYYLGEGVKENLNEAIKWLKKAAEHNDDLAFYFLGECYKEQNNYQEAIKWYRKGANVNEAYSQNALGLCYFNGNGVKESNADAFFWFKKSAENNLPYSMGERNLGYCYMNGFGTQKNTEKARYWLEKALEDGADVQELLDELDNDSGSEYDPENRTAESLWYWAQQCDPLAMEDLGYALFYGEDNDDLGVEGIEEDVNEAAIWFEKAAKEGMEFSQRQFAYMCDVGIGVPQNYQRALKWYKKAAEQGNGWACHRLFGMYRDGLGCSANTDIAMNYYFQACNLLNDGNEICPGCGSANYTVEAVSSGAGKGAAIGAGTGAIFGLIGMAAGAAIGSMISKSETTQCTCGDCGNQWEKIF